MNHKPYRCHVKDCGYTKSYLPENPSDLLPVLERKGSNLPSEAQEPTGVREA